MRAGQGGRTRLRVCRVFFPHFGRELWRLAPSHCALASGEDPLQCVAENERVVFAMGEVQFLHMTTP